MNHNLVSLACSLRTYHPKLDKNLQDTEMKELFDENYKKIMKDNEDLKKRINELTKQNGKLQMKKNIVNDMQSELDELTTVSRNFGDLDKKYVKTIWKQNQEYRQGLIKMGTQACDYNDILNKSKNDLMNAQNNIGLISKQLESYKDEITSLNQHIKYLEDNVEEQQNNSNLKSDEIKQEMEQKMAKIMKDKDVELKERESEITDLKKRNLELNTKIAELTETIANGQSETMAMKDQIQQHAEYQARQQLKKMEDTLSKMTVQKIQMEDDFNSRMKIEQEKADKYRAKYESVKQHVKTLEMQKSEYTRVNMQLRNQNNQFRSMITQLQNQVRNGGGIPNGQINGSGRNLQNNNGGGNELLDDDNDDGSNDGAIGPFARMNQQQQQRNGFGGRGGPPFGRGIPPRRGIPPHGRGHPGGPGMRGRGNPMMRGRGNPMMRGRGIPPQFGRGRGNPMMRGRGNPMMRGRGRVMPPQFGGNGRGNGGPNGQHQHASSVQSMPGAKQNGNNNNNNDQNGHQGSKSMVDKKISNPINNSVYKPQRDLWGKRTKTISEKGNKKRVLVEWHFVTSDNQPHTVVLQHTQDNKPKTRRMLWVDGSEKYNNKSSASSFRIEIDKDVVVVSIDYVDSQYQYRLNINAMNYTEAFNLWKSRQK